MTETRLRDFDWELNSRTVALKEENIRLRKAIRDITNNLGVPQPGYPAPVAEAYRIAELALMGEVDEATRKG